MANQNSSGLQKRIIDIGLTKGVNRKRDQHQLSNGELITAENVIFTNVDGQICKRNGFAAVTPQGAAFQGGPFKAIGCRDNVEPLIIGQNTLNRYNPATNLSTALPTPTQGRLDVSPCAGSSGRGSLAVPPMHASCATDGSSYICSVWTEVDSGGALMYYGVQDLATGNWIISPRTFSFTVANKTYGSVTYSTYMQVEPMVTYSNGYFYVWFLWVGSGTSNSTTVYCGTVMCGQLQLTNLAAGLTLNSYSANIASNISWSYPVCPLSYDVHMSGSKFFVGYYANNTAGTFGGYYGTVSSAAVFTQSMTVGGSTAVDRTALGTLRVSCKCDGPSGALALATQYDMMAFASTGDVYGTISISSGAPSRVSPCPVDILAVGTKWVWVTTANVGTSSAVQKTVPYVVVCDANQANRVNIIGQTPATSFYCEQLSRAFTQAVSNKVYFWFGVSGTSSDSVYNSAFLFEVDLSTQVFNTVARTLYTSLFHITWNDRLRPCEVIKLPNTQKYVTFLSAGAEKASGSPWQAYGTLNRVTFDFAPNRMPQVVPLPTGGVMIAGGYPLYYDGNDVVEAGFSNPATSEAMNQTAWAQRDASNNFYGRFYITGDNSAGGIGLVGGTNTQNASGYIEYYYVICFVRRDAYGNVYRSAPSPVITVPAQYLNTQVIFPGYTTNAGGNIQVELYRSKQATPGTYYKLAVFAPGTSYTDIQPDQTKNAQGRVTFDLGAAATVYTNSGELPNDPPPAVHHMAVSEQRGFLIPADNRNVVWYSKQFSPGRTVEWCANLTLSEGLNSGQFEGLAVMDSFLIVFKKNQILYTTGNGPDNTGANGGFAPFQKIASDVGCIEAASIAVIPDGVVFKSYRGIELLTRGLQLVYIGENVESLVAQNGPLSSIVLMPNFMELRFIPAKATNTITNPDGSTSTVATSVLTYDYGDKRWSTQTNMAAVQAVNINNDYYFISADGSLVNKETPGKYLDNGTPITMTLETPEIPVGSAGMQGWGRAYRMGLLGDFFSAHTLTIQFAYDHSSIYTDTVTFNTASGLISGETVEQFRLSRMPRSTMQTVRIKISDSGQSGLGQSCAISDLLLEVGDKNGLARLPGIKTL